MVNRMDAKKIDFENRNTGYRTHVEFSPPRLVVQINPKDVTGIEHPLTIDNDSNINKESQEGSRMCCKVTRIAQWLVRRTSTWDVPRSRFIVY